jgi:hypothetical protein
MSIRYGTISSRFIAQDVLTIASRALPLPLACWCGSRLRRTGSGHLYHMCFSSPVLPGVSLDRKGLNRGVHDDQGVAPENAGYRELYQPQSGGLSGPRRAGRLCGGVDRRLGAVVARLLDITGTGFCCGVPILQFTQSDSHAFALLLPPGRAPLAGLGSGDSMRPRRATQP